MNKTFRLSVLIMVIALAMIVVFLYEKRQSRSLRVDTSQTTSSGTVNVGDDGLYQDGPNTP